ncbi:MAG: hypothetical protein M3P23_04190 [Actinomycetota bacterium]|nr:hypothetical protein [Actinomycetota bacterium]
MTTAVTRRLAWVVFVAAVLMFLASGVLAVVLLHRPLAVGSLQLLLFLAPAVAGILIARRQPDNRIAWILLAIGAIVGFGAASEPYVAYGVGSHPGSLPAASYVAAVSGGLWVPTLGLTSTYLVLLFPDGRLPSSRWRPVAWASGITMSLLVLTFTFAPGTFEQNPTVRNPLGIDALKPALSVALVALPILPLCMLASAAGLVVRFRRSRSVERLQLKWLASAAAVVASVYLVMMVLSWYFNTLSGEASPRWLDVLGNIAVLTFVLIPIAIVVAILKHGLYGIDRLISRTVSYAVITGTLLSIYLGLVAAASSLAPKGSPLGVAASTLVVAALFQPLRRRVQAAVDRRFNRARYDAGRTVEAFSARLRDEVDLEALQADLLGVVHKTVQPASAGLWLRKPTGASP